MSAIHIPDSPDLPQPPTKERRTRSVDPATTPKRRINDTLFNKLRWPTFLGIWFVVGLALLMYFIFALIGL